jgi:protein-disulfide isomerase-like protein with CxxC motif
MINISSAITFEEAIASAQSLLEQREQAVIEDAEFGAAVTELTATHHGARGFFVAYLTDSRELVDMLTPVVAAALQHSTEIPPELLVKNLAMSTAMEITHRRNQNPEQAAQSAQVQQRTAALMNLLGFPYFKADAEALWQAVTTEAGSYAAFLKRWGYDAEQKTAIAQSLQTVCPEVAAMTP